MNKKRVLITAGLSLVIAMSVWMANVKISSAQECRIIRLTANTPAEAVFIEPETARISVGTCVVWVNWVSDDYQVQVSFSDPTRCFATTKASSGFHPETESCYATEDMLKGMTSSLMFTKPGTYEYGVKVKNGAQAKGKIVVSPMMAK